MEAWTCPHRYAAALQAGTDEMRRGARPLLAAILRSSSATPLAVQGRTTTEDTEHTEGHRGSSSLVLGSSFLVHPTPSPTPPRTQMSVARGSSFFVLRSSFVVRASARSGVRSPAFRRSKKGARTLLSAVVRRVLGSSFGVRGSLRGFAVARSGVCRSWFIRPRLDRQSSQESVTGWHPVGSRSG